MLLLGLLSARRGSIMVVAMGDEKRKREAVFCC
jgi:hypothetical protein